LAQKENRKFERASFSRGFRMESAFYVASINHRRAVPDHWCGGGGQALGLQRRQQLGVSMVGRDATCSGLARLLATRDRQIRWTGKKRGQKEKKKQKKKQRAGRAANCAPGICTRARRKGQIGMGGAVQAAGSFFPLLPCWAMLFIISQAKYFFYYLNYISLTNLSQAAAIFNLAVLHIAKNKKHLKTRR